MKRIQRSLLPENLEPGREPLARLGVSVLLGSLVVSAGIVAASFMAGEAATNRAFLLLIVTTIVSLWLFRSGQMVEAAYLYSTLLWLVITFVTLVAGDGIKGVQILGFPVLILVSALIIGRTGAVLYAVLSSISFIGISLVQRFQLLRPYDLADRVGLLEAIGAVVVFAAVALIQRALFRHLDESQEKVRQQERELQSTMAEVHESQAALESAFEHRTGQIQSAAAVAQAAGARLDPDEILEQTVQLVSERFGYYFAAIYLLDENRIWAELKAATGEAGRDLLARQHRLQVGGATAVGTAIATGRTRASHDVGPESARFDEPLLPETRSQIVLPLIASGQILGALDLQSVIEKAFSEEDIRLLQNMANQVAVSLENARLHLDTLNRLRELTGLYGRQELKTLQSLQLRGRELATNQPITLPDLERILAEKRVSVRHHGDQTVATIPMLSGGQVVGVLTMKSKNRRWNEEEITIIESIASQSAVALENARLVRESQIRAERERVFSESTARMRETLDIETILQTAAEEMRRALSLARVEVQIGAPAPPPRERSPGNGEPQETDPAP